MLSQTTRFSLAIIASLFLSIIAISCTTTDAPPAPLPKSDLIVGDWVRHYEAFVFENDSVVIIPFICPKKSTIVFMDKRYEQFYSAFLFESIDTMANPPCKVVSNYGRWYKTGEGNYKAEVKYFDDYDPLHRIADTIYYTASFPAADSLVLHNRNKLEHYQSEIPHLKDYYVTYSINRYTPELFPH